MESRAARRGKGPKGAACDSRESTSPRLALGGDGIPRGKLARGGFRLVRVATQRLREHTATRYSRVSPDAAQRELSDGAEAPLRNATGRSNASGPADAGLSEACVKRQSLCACKGSSRCWHERVRIVATILICVFVSAIIIYWFVSSIMENRRDGRHRGSSAGGSRNTAHLERLPDHVLPLEYTLRILPVLEEGNFTTIGDVEIQFYSKIPTKHVRLHACGLRVRDLSVTEYRDRPLNASRFINRYVQEAGEDFIDVFLLQTLMAGEIYVLRVKYTAPLQQKSKGLFRSSHVDRGTNETRWIAVSNLSPDYARRAFPCFDEPWLKTPFRISIGRRSDMRSHSNSMRKVTEDIRGLPGYVWDHYEKTLPMPTYVVAFMVSDFVGYRVNVTDRPSHTIFSRREVVNDTRYMSELVPKVLRLIQNFTGFYYELDKLDVIVVPKLMYSAMENWGLITIWEDIAVMKAAGGGIIAKKVLASIAAHEIAHQWFGNLVTPRWWDDVWLKEGFSSFFGFLALSVLEPESWDRQASFLAECHDVFHEDASEAAHPLHIDPQELSGLIGVFDLTSYAKGNCMAHMIYHFLGERVYLASVRRYMRTYYYRSADQEDLWSAFQLEIDYEAAAADGLPASSGLRMKDVMRTWTYQAGFPVLRVRQNRETGALELTQGRFYHYGLNSTSQELWHIPLTWTTENEQQFGNTLPKAWMDKKRMKINDTALSRASLGDQWILFNINQTALYRVNYDVENWKLLLRSFRALPEVAKVQLLADSFALANAGLLDMRITWSILEKLRTETGEMLWMHAILTLTTVKDYFWDSNVFEFAMCKVADKVYAEMARSLARTDPASWTEFKVNVMKWACSLGHRACLTAARDYGRKMLRNESSSSSVPEEFRTWTYCAFAREATGEQWLALLARYNGSTAHDKESLAFALGCHVNAGLLRRYLSTVFSQTNVTCSHAEAALMSVVINPHGYRVAADFLTEHWDEFSVEEAEGSSTYANVPLTATLRAFVGRIRRQEDVEWLRQLRGRHDKYDTVIGQVINRVQANVAWYEKYKNETLRLLEEISAGYAETRDCRRRD
ncbi:thyrotropin-releasing hormone-degrading ectoenzyme-like [Harpegnathos saltator]|uniref:thyrotropin-releasing hormone-degrading ectoenzyme-like n=1 Tax=Harpegnathos saltator TaxID=610380 RepID=UPI000948E7FB|nr:thyrotropin-releasing hormone-degrading ectoenzyme-like [Harpegnathos saltator]